MVIIWSLNYKNGNECFGFTLLFYVFFYERLKKRHFLKVVIKVLEQCGEAVDKGEIQKIKH